MILERWHHASRSWFLGAFGPPMEKWEVLGVNDGTVRKSDGSPLWPCLNIRPQLAIEYVRRSNQQGVGHFGAKFGEEVIDRCKANFNTIWERHGSAMHERDRQTERQTGRPRNGNIDSNRQNSFRRCRL